MPNARFTADFTSFVDAVQKAEVELRSFETSTSGVERQLGRMTDSFSGRKVIADAQLMARAVEEVGGVSKLTETELARIGTTAQEAVAKMRALGIDVPPGILKIAEATKQTESGFAAMLGPLRDVNNLLGLVGAGVSVGAIVSIGRAAFDAADGLTRMSDQTGISIDALQRLQAVAEPSGQSLEQVTSGVSKLQKNLAEGTKGTVEALKDLRLSLADVRSMNADEAFFAIAKGIQEIKNPAEQTRVAMELFGRSGAELLPTLKADIDSLKDSTVRMSEDSAKALDDLGDAFQRWKTDAINAVGEAIGAITRATKEANDTLGGKLPDLLKGALSPTSAVPDIFKSLREQFAPTPVAPPVAGSQIQAGSGFGTAGLRDLFGSAAPLEQNANATKAIAADLALAEQRASGFTAAMQELDAAVGKASVTVAGMNGDVVEAIKFYLQAGVSQGTLQKAYALTATEVAAVAKVLADERDALKLEQEAIAATARLWSEYDAVRSTQGTTSTDQAIANVLRWADETAAAAAKAGTDTAAFYDALAATTSAKLQAIAVDWDAINGEMTTGTKAGLQQIADQARATYEEALKHVGEFSDESIQRFRDTADAAQLAASAFGTGFEAAGQKASAAVADTVRQVQDAKRELDMMFAGANVPTSDSLSAAGRRPGSFLGTGSTPMVASILTSVANLPWPARATGGNVSAGQPYMVGERGPELFTPGASGAITPTDALGGSTPVVINVSGVLDPSTASMLADKVGEALLRRVARRFPGA